MRPEGFSLERKESHVDANCLTSSLPRLHFFLDASAVSSSLSLATAASRLDLAAAR